MILTADLGRNPVDHALFGEVYADQFCGVGGSPSSVHARLAGKYGHPNHSRHIFHSWITRLAGQTQ